VVGIGNAVMSIAAHSGGFAVLIAGMALLGSGGGLLNGETQKAIMGTVPRDRAGMASGISTTSRFSGILLGFSGLGAVLAVSVHDAVLRNLANANVPAAPGFVDRIVAGDFERAAQLYPQSVVQSVAHLARTGYGAGFGNAFLAAAVFALAAAVIVFCSMRRSAR
jgi:hypothetical protein